MTAVFKYLLHFLDYLIEKLLVKLMERIANFLFEVKVENPYYEEKEKEYEQQKEFAATT